MKKLNFYIMGIGWNYNYYECNSGEYSIYYNDDLQDNDIGFHLILK